jgi:hypothetical protein
MVVSELIGRDRHVALLKLPLENGHFWYVAEVQGAAADQPEGLFFFFSRGAAGCKA